MNDTPRSNTHQRQKSKNLFALIALSMLVAGLYYLTMLKLSGH